MSAMRVAASSGTPVIFPLRQISTRHLAERLAASAQTDVESAMRFLQTNLRNGGATQAGDKDRYTFTTREAARFMLFVWKGANFRGGQGPGGAKLRRFRMFADHAARLFHHEFFDGADLSLQNAKHTGLDRPIPLVLAGPDAVHDGDTWKGLLRIPGGKALKSSMRFASYDAPEVSGSKLRSQKQRVMKQYRQAVGRDRGAAEHALDVHLRYQGALTTLLWKSFVRYAQQRGAQFEMAAAFVGGTQCQDACGQYEMVGNYGRWIGMPQVTQDRLIGDFLREQLPVVMATEGEQLRQSFLSELGDPGRHRALLTRLRRRGARGQELANMIDAARWLQPKKAFAAKRANVLSARWNALTRRSGADAERRGYARDLSAMTIHVGLGYHYNKYPSQRSPFYEHLEAGAKRAQAGLWENPLFSHMEWTPRA